MANTTSALTDEQKSNLQRSRILEERLLQWLDEMTNANLVAVNQHPPYERPYDGRCVSLARTNLETAFMWLNKAICKPPRLNLEEEDTAQA